MFIEPVFGKKFFGREEVLATLNKRVTALKGGYRQNLALSGPMLSGKSSILRHFLKNIHDPDIIPLYIEMGEEDFTVFCLRFKTTLLFRYLKSIGQKCGTELRELKKECRKTIPETVRQIDDISRALKDNKRDIAFKKLLELTSIFKTETGKSCIVILDEFHNLIDFHLKKPFQVFGKFIMVQKNTMYIVSSSQRTLLKDILAKKLSLLFGNFETIDIGGFDTHIASSFISDKICSTPSSAYIKDYLVQLTAGNPFYLEVLAKRFSEIAAKSAEEFSDKECLVTTFAELLYESKGILNQYFMNTVNFFLEKKARKRFLPVLFSMADGNCTIKSIQGDIGGTAKDIGSRLQLLLEMDILFKNGVFYKLDDKLFEYWLKYVYKMKTQSPVDDMDIKYLEFKESIETDLTAYGKFNAMNLKEVISDLFSRFRGQKIQVVMNDRKLPHFDKVESHVLSGNIIELICSKGNVKWICRVKLDGLADEHDISSLKEFRPERKDQKISRRIFMPLKGIEQNAFLLAKDRNIWVWDTKQLNTLLRLFGKFELVL